MILRARWVAPVCGPPIHNGYIELDGAEIRRVGAWPPKPLSPGATRESASNSTGLRTEHLPDALDLGDSLLTPGLVNPHTHLELGCYAGLLPPGPFWPWIAGLTELRSEPGRLEHERAAAGEWARRSLAAGVTCVGDISRCNVAWRVLKDVPIRKVCYVELLALAGQPPRNIKELRAAVEQVQEDDLLTVGVTPHAPYTVPAADVRRAIALAHELERPWTIHLAETPQELAFLAGGRVDLPAMLVKLMRRCGVKPTGQRPVEYIEQCAEGLCRGTLAHGNYIDNSEHARLAAAGHTVVYCPRAHHFFGHPPHPLARLRRAGVRVAIGTDSPASNENVQEEAKGQRGKGAKEGIDQTAMGPESMLAELHHVHRHVADAPPPAELLEMATIDAAAALSLEDRIGTLAPGRQADIAAWPCAAQPVEQDDGTDPVRALIERPAAPLAVWVAGKRVV